MDIAVAHKVTRCVVGRIVKQFKADPEWINQLEAKHLQKVDLEDATVQSAVELLKKNRFIWKTSDVVSELKTNQGLAVSQAYVSRILKEHLDMKYTAIRQIQFQGNS